MKNRTGRFNTYLPLLLCSAMACGCQSSDPHKKELTVLRLHLETNPDGTDKIIPAKIGRENPFVIQVQKESFLEEIHLTKADVLDDGLGGFFIKVQFDKQGMWLLEQYTTANKGRRIAVMAEFGQARWIAAPRIVKRTTDGTFSFTPDATREETDRIVRGLKNAIKKERSKNSLHEDEPE